MFATKLLTAEDLGFYGYLKSRVRVTDRGRSKLLHDCYRTYRRASSTANFQRQRDEHELFHSRFGQRLQVQAFDDVDAPARPEDGRVDFHVHDGTFSNATVSLPAA